MQSFEKSNNNFTAVLAFWADRSSCSINWGGPIVVSMQYENYLRVEARSSPVSAFVGVGH